MKPYKLVKTARGIFEPAITEEMVVNEIMVRLAFAGIRVWRIRERYPTRTKSGNWSRKSTPGIPDLLGHIPGKLFGYRACPAADSFKHMLLRPVPLFIEVKKPGGKHRPAQEAFISEAKSAGAVAMFADSWEAVRTEMRAVGVELPE